MKPSVLVLFAVVAAVVQAHDPDPRLHATAGRIAHLEKEIDELGHEIEQAEKIDPLGFIVEMHARLDQVEGTFDRIALV